MFEHACKLGLEGVVSKVRDTAYASGRGNSWVKKTCAQRETLAIAGFALDGTKWDGLYVGRRKGDDLVYAGNVGQGFDKVSAADLRKRLQPLVRKMQPYSKRIAHKGIWVEPKLLRNRMPGENRVRSFGNNPFEAHAAGLGEDVPTGPFEMFAEMQMAWNDGTQCLLSLQQGLAPQIDAIEVECIEQIIV
jgi:bifunctional non-homologous end joining protein LigD